LTLTNTNEFSKLLTSTAGVTTNRTQAADAEEKENYFEQIERTEETVEEEVELELDCDEELLASEDIDSDDPNPNLNPEPAEMDVSESEELKEESECMQFPDENGYSDFKNYLQTIETSNHKALRRTVIGNVGPRLHQKLNPRSRTKSGRWGFKAKPGKPLGKSMTAEEKMKLEIAAFDRELEKHSSDAGYEAPTALIAIEVNYYADPYYFDKTQREITWLMRAILIDWLQDVSMGFTLKRETLHYAINYIDRYLSVVPNVDKKSFQLLGVTSLYIASKMEVNHSSAALANPHRKP